ncbi:tRNA (N6-isopentenyl adenosine(37)-C2)-methylthiotransferase MiaB [Alkalibacter rhizosphaerae]|nr:tRNA (N6-isopentenyl adenosine(37)-C2)-methylthiotransferase MiaB [Alkalibacter rhizosphaerae]
MKFKITTYGCQMNENDSEKISGMLKNLGHLPVVDEKEADLVILNTCSVRENANDKFFGHLGYFKRLKETNPKMVLCVCGCMMQQESVIMEVKSRHRHVDIIFGTHNIHEFPQLLDQHLEKEEMIVDVWKDGADIVENLPVDHRYPFKAYVSIMHGCNNFCSYCIVPYTRGRERSRKMESIILEVEALAANGCKEVTLLGQNVNSYGDSLEEPATFSELLTRLANVEGLERIRFMTSHPKDLSDDLIRVIAEEKKVCNHVHLPVQSGSSKVLREMNRKYTKEQYLQLVEKIRKEVPEVAITTDIIIGFPGETEDDFEETLDLMRLCSFDLAFTFLYSTRELTPASQREDQVPDDIKHQRMDRLLEVHHEISRAQNEKYLGKIVEVLVEGLSKNNPDRVSGRTETAKLVNFPGDESMVGQIVKVKITDAKTFSLDGTIIE